MFWCVQGMSQILVTKVEMLAKNLLAVPSEKVARRKKKEKKIDCVKRKRKNVYVLILL